MNENDDAQPTRISKARTPQEIGEFWDNHSLDDYWEETHEVEFELRAKRKQKATIDTAVDLERETGARTRGVLSETMAESSVYEYDIFLSHNHQDEEWTKELAARLEQERWQGRSLKVFFSPWDIRPGQSIPKAIERGLLKSRKIALVMSPEAMSSAWVELERLVTTHIDISERQERLIPLLLRDCEIPGLLRPILSIDFRYSSGFDEGYRKLLAVIEGEPIPRGLTSSSSSSISPLPSLPRPPVVGFIARRDKQGRDIVVRLVEELGPKKNQLIALWGAGGVGKTALAAEAAQSLMSAFAQRIVWVSAEGRPDFSISTLLDETATYLGRSDLRKLALDAKAEEVRALIAAADTLIVLDNFETIAPDEQALCKGYLHQLPTCPALITTRQKISGTHNIAIEAMTLPEAREFVARFIEQETHDQQAFAGLDRDHIIRVAERNPLILQWVIAQIDLAQSPQDVFDELAQGEGDAAHRVFDRSFRLRQVSNKGRDTLLALSLFAPSAPRSSLALVAGLGDDVRRLNKVVQPLASLWLVRVAQGNERLVVEGLTRELANAHLLRDKRAKEFQRRFVTSFVLYAETHQEQSATDYDALELEKPNLLIALELAAAQRDFRRVIRLTMPLLNMLYTRGYWDEALRAITSALNASTEINDRWHTGAFADALGNVLVAQGDYSNAERYCEMALEVARELGDQQALVRTLLKLGLIKSYQSNTAGARLLYKEGLQISRQRGYDSDVATAQNCLGKVAMMKGDLDEAFDLYSSSLDIFTKTGNQQGIAMCLHNLGTVNQMRGDSTGAKHLYDDSRQLNEQLGNHRAVAENLNQLASIACDEGHIDQARELYERAIRIFEKLGDQHGLSSALNGLGLLAETDGHKADAIQLFEEALKLVRKLGISDDITLIQRNLERLRTQPD